MRRTLILDDDDLIMVVGKEITHQIDSSRGEMTRTEFLNFLIRSQLSSYRNGRNFVDKEEFCGAIREIRELMRSMLELVLSLEATRQPEDNGFPDWLEKVKSLKETVSEEQV